MKPIKDTRNPSTVTLQPDNVTYTIRRNRPFAARRYTTERARFRLVRFCLDAGWKRVETGIGPVYRNWI